MSFDWYPFDRVAYKRKTAHLSLAEDGAYRRLIDEYMAAEGPLPDNDAALARLIGVGIDEWLAVSKAMRSFFEASNGKLIHERCEEELRAQAMHKHCKSKIGKDAANARWKNHNETKQLLANALPTQSARNANGMHSDATRHSKKITTTESVAASEEKPSSSAGSLATALPTGALRSPASRKIEVSPELRNLAAEKYIPP